MPDRTDKEMLIIRAAVKDYVETYGATSTREIAEAVEDETGLSVSHQTVSVILRELGYVAARWVHAEGE